MKPQDLIFLLILLFLIFKKNPNWSAWAGVISLILSIPLFSFWIFFTAQRLVMYSAAFLLLSIIFHILKPKANE